MVLGLAAVLGLDCGDEGPLAGGTEDGSIVGEVTLDGVPRAGVTLTLRIDAEIIATASTDAGGDYEFPDLDPDTYRVGVSIAGANCPGERTVVVEAGEPTVINFACSTPGAGAGNLAGLVVGGTGFTVLVVRDPAGTVAAQGVVGEGGEFNFSNLAAGNYIVRILPPDGANVTCPEESVTVRAGETASVTILCA